MTSFSMFDLDDDNMIPFCEDEISTRPARADFTPALHGEINFIPGRRDTFLPGTCLQKAVDSH